MGYQVSRPRVGPYDGPAQWLSGLAVPRHGRFPLVRNTFEKESKMKAEREKRALRTYHLDTLFIPTVFLQVLASVDDTDLRNLLYFIGIMLVPSKCSVEKPAPRVSDVGTHPGLG